MTNPLQSLIAQADKEFSEKFTSVWNSKHSELIRIPDGIKGNMQSHFHQLLLSIAKGEVARNNPVELAEKIVIEYANISGRESENRAFVREAAIKVLSDTLSPWKSVVRGLEK